MDGRRCANPMLPKSDGTPESIMTAAERRAERRYRGKGALKLSFNEPSHQEISGRLLDYSQSGFRAVHTYPALDTGRARVMWNRIADECVETGFLVIK